MYLSKILLSNFRSYSHQLFEFSPGINLILGPNGSGKTNILESIQVLSQGKSFRTNSLSNLIKWDQAYSSIKAKYFHPDESELEVQLINDPQSRQIKRRFLVDKVVKTRKLYFGSFKTVVFDPEDIRLVSGSPSRRRDFLDKILSPIDWRYPQALSQYTKALNHRNELLDLIYQGKSQKTELFYWDQSLIKNSEIVHKFRSDFIRFANFFFNQHQNAEIRQLHINYFPSVITPDKLEASYALDLRRGYTQSGLHRDDYSLESSLFTTSDKNLHLWGSRGQQRLAVLALKLAEINYIESLTKEQPILLLDDIFSELDAPHQQLVSDICSRYQSIFSSSEESSLQSLPQAHLIQI